jgi:hypothetical protein
VQVRPPAGATPSEGLPSGAVSRPENGWAYGLWGFDSLSFRLPGGMAELERQRVAIAQAATTARRFESCCLRLSRSGVVELGRRAVVIREIAGSIPAAGVLHALVVEAGDDAGPSTRKLRVRIPPRVLTIDGRALVDLAVRGGIRSREGEGEEVDPVLPPAPCRRSPTASWRSSSGCGGAGHPTGPGSRGSQVRILPARPCAVEERLSSRAS